MIFYVFCILVAVVAIGVYLTFFFSQVPGAKEERLGELEALPEGLGRWRFDDQSEEAKQALASGQRREVRVLYEDGGFFGGGKLVHQVRYRNAKTNAIERIEPERRTRRRRVKKH